MSEQNYANVQQQADLMKYISDNMKIPVLGAGGGFAPIGTEAYFDGTLAPQGWLICDGSTHNIADYPELVAYFASHHGSANYYGGDEVTTFAVPTRNGMPTSGVDTPDEHIVGEWREEVDGVLKKKPIYEKRFTVSVPNGNAVIHNIDAISIDMLVEYKTSYIDPRPSMGTTYYEGSTSDRFRSLIEKNGNGNWGLSLRANGMNYPCNTCTIIHYTKTTDSWQPIQEGHSSDGNGIFCIKATVSGDANAHQYSTEEQIVGMDENGNYVYEKTIPFTVTSTDFYIDVASLNIGVLRELTGHIIHNNGNQAHIPYYDTSGDFSHIYYNTQNSQKRLHFMCGGSHFTNATGDITIQYTKTQ